MNARASHTRLENPKTCAIVMLRLWKPVSPVFDSSRVVCGPSNPLNYKFTLHCSCLVLGEGEFKERDQGARSHHNTLVTRDDVLSFTSRLENSVIATANKHATFLVRTQ